MFKIFLLSLALTGLQALPISRSQTKTHHSLPSGVQDGLPVPLPGDFRQGTEPSRRFIVDLNTGLVQDYVSEMDRRTGFLSLSLGNGHGEMDRRHWLTDNTGEEVPVQKNGEGWVRVEGRATLPDGFRQGTEPSLGIAEGFRQGTEPTMSLRDGYRQGTERFMPIPDGFRQGTEPSLRIADGFRQGTEPSLGIQRGFRQGTERFMPIPDGFRQGTEPSLGIPAGFRQGTEPTDPIAYREVAEPLNVEEVRTIPEGFRQGTEPSSRIPEGFRQGTERFMPIPEGFRQGTEPSVGIPKGFRQGTERFMPLPDGFRQGTEPSLSIPNGFRQGTEPTNPIEYREIALPLNADTFPDGFRQGTEPSNPLDHKDAALSFQALRAEPSNHIVGEFKPGVGPFMPVWDSDRQETILSNHIQDSFSHVIEASKARQEPHTTKCNGEVINGRCYTFNPSPLPFLEAQDLCKRFHPNAELASVTNEDLHSRLVSMVTNGRQQDPVLTWLGGTVKNQQASWLDGSEWRYSDWMPGQPNTHTDKPVCMEMFRMGETWWAAADCDLKRASICSYPVRG